MLLEKDTCKALVKYLIKHGYPPESLAIEYPIGKYRVDLAVLDIDSKEPIALFEIKQERTSSTERFGRRQLQSFLSYLGTKSIPTYLVFAQEGTPPFEIERVLVKESQMQKDEEVIPPKEVFDFDILQKIFPNAVLAETKQKRKQSIEVLTAICLLISGILIVLLWLDAIAVLFITPIHLAIGGVIIALILIPFASRVKIWGFEFDRLRKGDYPKE